MLKIRKFNCLYFKNSTRYLRNSNGFEFRGVLAIYCKKLTMFVLEINVHCYQKPKIKKCRISVTKKDIAKIPTDLNSRSLEEQLVIFSRKSEIKNRFRRYRVNNTTIFIHKFTLSLICFWLAWSKEALFKANKLLKSLVWLFWKFGQKYKRNKCKKKVRLKKETSY